VYFFQLLRITESTDGLTPIYDTSRQLRSHTGEQLQRCGIGGVDQDLVL